MAGTIANETKVPIHVARDLVFDVDVFALGAGEDDVQLAWRRLQQELPDIFWTPRNGGHWIATRAREIKQIQRDWTSFSNSNIHLPRTSLPYPFVPLNLDPPEHGKYRAIIAPLFAPKQLDRLETIARSLAIELIEDIAPKGGCEFVRDFAEKLPVTVFLGMMDLPVGDRERLIEMGRPNSGASVEARAAGQQAMVGYLEDYIAARQREPGDDVISTIVAAEVDGRQMTPGEILGMCTLLLVGGLDTVAALMAFCARFLALNPGHRRRLVANPTLLPKAIEELIRRHGISNSVRVVTREMELAGARLKADDLIQIPTSLFGLDEREVDDPLRVDFARVRSRHAAFGHGPHVCVGSMLARRELGVFLAEWLKRIPNFEIAPGSVPEWSTGRLNLMRELQLRWSEPCSPTIVES